MVFWSRISHSPIGTLDVVIECLENLHRLNRTLVVLATCLTLSGCASKPAVVWTVELGDSERTMITKMVRQGARDVTNQTHWQFYHEIALEQRYYWWEFPDQTIVAILVAAPPKKEKTVRVTEIGEPHLG